MENIYMYSFVDQNQDDLYVIFTNSENFKIENFNFSDLKHNEIVLMAYKSNNYYEDNELFISIKDIYFNEKQRENLKKFIDDNGKITVKENNNLDIQGETRNIKYNDISINGCVDGFGQSNEIGMLILLANILQEDYKYLNNINNKILFEFPNIRKTSHFFVKLKINNNNYYYNSDYNDQEGNGIDKQCLSTSIQGLTSCFFYSMFFIKKCIELDKKGQLNFENLKKPETNLLIIRDTINFLCNYKNEYIFITGFEDFENIKNKDNYFCFKKDENFFVYMDRRDNVFQHLITSNNIELKHVYNQKNIFKYCYNHLFEMYSFENNSLQKVDNPNELIDKNYQSLSKSSDIYNKDSMGSSDEVGSDLLREFSEFVECISDIEELNTINTFRK